MRQNADAVVLLFSGGRDSSLAASLLARDGAAIRLVTTESGLGMTSSDVVGYRVEELARAFPANVLSWDTRRAPGLVRRVVFADIEEDFRVHKSNLLILGMQLTTITLGLAECLSQGIRTLATGFAGYQRHYHEQSLIAVEEIRRYCEEQGVSLSLPVYDYHSVDDVKYDLLDFGISTKSLETVSLLADSPSSATESEIRAYIRRKLPTCQRYLDFVGSKPGVNPEYPTSSGELRLGALLGQERDC